MTCNALDNYRPIVSLTTSNRLLHPRDRDRWVIFSAIHRLFWYGVCWIHRAESLDAALTIPWKTNAWGGGSLDSSLERYVCRIDSIPLAIWHSWPHQVPPIRFPEDKLPALNKAPPEKYERVPKELGGGVKGFLNVFHQLHCLVSKALFVTSKQARPDNILQNLVRQYTYRNDYDYSNVTAFRAPEELVRGHIDHCIETIRKSLMCTADVTPVVFEKVPSRPSGSKSDFNLWRKCRNFDRIQDWTIMNRGV